jgi:hypothetical protein
VGLPQPHATGTMAAVTRSPSSNSEVRLELLTKRIRILPGLQTTETFVYLKLNKQHYNWGTR